MLSSVTLYCRVTTTEIFCGSQLSEMFKDIKILILHMAAMEAPTGDSPQLVLLVFRMLKSQMILLSETKLWTIHSLFKYHIVGRYVLDQQLCHSIILCIRWKWLLTQTARGPPLSPWHESFPPSPPTNISSYPNIFLNISVYISSCSFNQYFISKCQMWLWAGGSV